MLVILFWVRYCLLRYTSAINRLKGGDSGYMYKYGNDAHGTLQKMT